MTIKTITTNTIKMGRIFSSNVMAHASSAVPAPKRVNMPKTIKKVVNIEGLPIYLILFRSISWTSRQDILTVESFECNVLPSINSTLFALARSFACVEK